MAETIRDFIILLAQLILILVIASVIFSPKGIVESVFAFSTYAEPVTLLNHLASVITTVSYAPGEATSSFKTSGVPYIVEIYKVGDTSYLSIDFSLVEQETNIRYEPIEAIPIISDCEITDQKLVLTEGIIQEITVKKIIKNGDCLIYIVTEKVPYDFNVTVFPESGFVLNGSSTTAFVTVSLVDVKISPGPIHLSALGEPDGVTITFSKNDMGPEFDSEMTVYAGPSTTPGTYYITIMGKSDRLARTALFILEVSPLYYTFVLNTEVNIAKLPLTGVEVNVSDDIKYTTKHNEFISNVVYGMIPKSYYYVDVEDLFNSREFSHLRDFDCENSGQILDTDNDPYWFDIINKSRNMTAYYRALTQIRNLEFNNTTSIISGNLLDEDFNPIAQKKDKYQTCGAPPTPAVINRDVRLEYFDGTAWIPIGWAKSSFTNRKRFYDDFDDNDYDDWTVTGGTWNVVNGELSSSGSGDEVIETKWNYWNSSGGNDNLEVSIRLIAGNNINVKIFDAFNEYYIQICGPCDDMELFVNGVSVEAVNLGGKIDLNQWNTWRIKQNESIVEVYINDEKWMKYDGVPLFNNGKIQLRTLNTEVLFDNVIAYDGSWSYPFACVYGMQKIRANYIPLDWYYNYTSAEIDIDSSTCPYVGTLDVFAFDNGNQIGATVAIGRGDVNWDGVVDNADLFFYDSNNPNSCMNTVLGDANWDIDCDMNLDNRIDYDDFQVIAGEFGKTIPIDTTRFSVNLAPGTYVLRAKYNEQIKNNLSVVINPGEVTEVYFRFLPALDVFAFDNGNQIGATVAIGLGDVNWDGVVDNADLFFYDSTNPNSCYDTVPGDANWDIDCDMNLDNRINNDDWMILVNEFGKTIPIDTTRFSVNLAPGTYVLRAKYNEQIKNNLSVVMNPAELTEVYFRFLPNLDVFAFDNGNQIGATVAIGLGDINWDGVVDNADFFFYDSTNPNSCYDTVPGDANWDIDCDMNLDNRINNDDFQVIAGEFGKTIPIDTTRFSVNLAPGTYVLRAKYNEQIKNNLSVVINPGEVTEVYFRFLPALDVFAFDNGNQIGATVAIGRGDVNWDGVVDNADLFFYDSNNPNSCMNTVLGDANWDIDCDMNLDNRIDISDFVIVTFLKGSTIPIDTTRFSVNLAPGTYVLRAKYNEQIKNNLSVVINPGEVTEVYFRFLFECTPGNDIICHSSYPDGLYNADACSNRHWSRSTCGFGEVCKQGFCNSVNADLTSYSLPIGTHALSDTIAISYTIQNTGDITWTFLTESPIFKPGIGFIYLNSWDEVGSGVSMGRSITYNIRCDDPTGTWNSRIYAYTDTIAMGGWLFYPASAAQDFKVVQCLDNNDCQTCNIPAFGTTSTCIGGNICCTCNDWADGNCFQEASPICPTGRRRQTRSCTPAACDVESQCIPDSTCCGFGGEVCVASATSCQTVFGGTPVALDGCTGATPVCCDV